MRNFTEVLTNSQAKNINKISDEIGKKLENLTRNSSINKKVIRKLSLYGGLTSMSKLTDWWTPPKI